MRKARLLVKADPGPSCSSCKAWEEDTEDHDEKTGLCRRRSPQVITDGESVMCIWPTTSAQDWCAEFIAGQ